MKHLLLVLGIGGMAIDSYSQSNCDMIQEYQRIFNIRKIQYGEQEYLLKSVNRMEEEDCFSGLINNNSQYIDYLQTHFSDNSNYDDLMAANDSIELHNMFISALQTDSMFNDAMNKLADKAMGRLNFIPDTVSMNELLNIAVKYFAIIGINEKGSYIGKVCTGINALEKTEEKRSPQIEAFCFSAILENYQGEHFNMHDEFVKGIKQLYSIHLGTDHEDRLLRAQGAMFMFMRNNGRLKELLLFEYERKKEFLPFMLI